MQNAIWTNRARSNGFTLVELMMVIAIIGVLVGLTVVGVNAGRKAIMRRAIAMDVQSLAQAVEAYKLKYGEYPPDGSNRSAFEAHFRGAFPNIVQSEFAVLYSQSPNGPSGEPLVNSNSPVGVMDPAEALVFCLGGFSNDPQHPFTGSGGPLYLTVNGSQVTSETYLSSQGQKAAQYNLDRAGPIFEFLEERLSLHINNGRTESNDEDLLKVVRVNMDGSMGVPPNDLLPVYIPRGRAAPVVYFASSTYSTSNPAYFNFYSTEAAGIARPYKSDAVNTTAGAQSGDRFYRYMNEKSFQIISAGLDDQFGGAGFWGNSTPIYFRFPSGQPLNIGLEPDQQPAGAVYRVADTSIGDPVIQSQQLDNVTNFSEGTLDSSLP